MDKDTVVKERTESGERLISALAADGFDVRVAFWAKPSDDGKWFLYLACSMVDDNGPSATYRLVFGILRKVPDLRIDPLEIRVVGLKDSLTEAVLAVLKPEISPSPYAIRNPKPYPGMTWFGGEMLGGLSIDGAYIYPPLQLGASA